MNVHCFARAPAAPALAPALVLALIFTLSAEPPTAGAAEIATRAGTNQMLFVFSGLSSLQLAGFNGGFGLRHYLKDGVALRPGVSFGWSSTRTHPDQPTGDPKPTNAREIDTSVGLELALEKHLEGPRSISPYLGAGIFGFYVNNKTEPSVATGSPQGTVTKITTKETDGGLFGLLGFEWGWTESLTLGGETRFGLTINTGKVETEAVRTPDRLSHDRSGFDLGFRTASVFLGVSF
jgi:hypothetical protein